MTGLPTHVDKLHFPTPVANFVHYLTHRREIPMLRIPMAINRWEARMVKDIDDKWEETKKKQKLVGELK